MSESGTSGKSEAGNDVNAPRPKTLILDDEESIRLTFCEFLRRAGHETFTASNLAEARALLVEHTFDVAIIDIMVGNDSGLEIASQIRSDDTNTQIVLVTGRPDFSSAREALILRAFDYLAKPVDRDTLINVAAKAYQKKRDLDDFDAFMRNQAKEKKNLQQTAEDSQAALNESETRYRDLIENINDIILELDLNGCICFISGAAERLLGHLPAEVEGQHFSTFVHPDDRATLLSAFEKNISGDLFPNEYRLISKAGEPRWFRSSSRLAYDAKGNVSGLHGVCADISDLKATETALRAQMDELSKWHDLTLHREERVQAMKLEVNELLARQGQPPRYADPAQSTTVNPISEERR